MRPERHGDAPRRSPGGARLAPGIEKASGGLGGHRLVVEEPLRERAALVEQEVDLADRFDPLGDHVEAEAGGKADDGAHNRRVVLIMLDVADEALVDLERVDGVALEVRQRSEAGAEIVERDPLTEREHEHDPYRGILRSGPVLQFTAEGSARAILDRFDQRAVVERL